MSEKKFHVVIGLEIHAQMNTATKMFCSCENSNFGKNPNESVCEVCMGFPGVLPAPNKEAMAKATRAGLALGCDIPEHCKFDRKNYFYPDLPFGYQISQFDEPLAVHGAVKYELNGEEKICRIHRLHVENDAGKLVHAGGNSFCDYNRAGSPLMEIVTEPDLRTAEEASAFAQELARILQFVGSSECDMFKGQMRFDASVSLRESEDADLTPRAEIKNLNSFRALEQGIAFEIKRQTENWEKTGGPAERECTVGWVDDLGETKFLRWKESSADYRYFPEPDIPPVVTTAEMVADYRKEVPELPMERRKRYREDLGLSKDDADTLVDNPKLCLFYEKVAEESKQAKKAANWVLSELLGLMKKNQASIEEIKFGAEDLAEILKLVEANEISGKQGKEILEIMYETGKKPAEIIEEKGMKQVSDTGELEKILDEIIATPMGADAVEQFKSGRERALGYIVGQVMKQTGGSANPGLVNELLQKKIA